MPSMIPGQVIRLKVKRDTDGKGFIRTKKNGGLDANGGGGEWTQFELERTWTGLLKLKSTETNKYIRINEQGDADCLGTGGPWTEFYLIRHRGEIQLKNKMHNKLLGCTKDGEHKKKVGDGPAGRFLVSFPEKRQRRRRR